MTVQPAFSSWRGSIPGMGGTVLAIFLAIFSMSPAPSAAPAGPSAACPCGQLFTEKPAPLLTEVGATLLQSVAKDVAAGHEISGPRSPKTGTLPRSGHCTF